MLSGTWSSAPLPSISVKLILARAFFKSQSSAQKHKSYDERVESESEWVGQDARGADSAETGMQRVLRLDLHEDGEQARDSCGRAFCHRRRRVGRHVVRQRAAGGEEYNQQKSTVRAWSCKWFKILQIRESNSGLADVRELVEFMKNSL